MTGGTYAAMRRHTVLGKLMSKEDSRFDAYAFDAGQRRSADAGGLLHHLFGVRTLELFGRFSEAALPSYLSGLLIGHEVRSSGLFSRTPRPAQAHIIGNDRLIDAYARTLVALGMGVQRHSESLAAHGMHRLSRNVDSGAVNPQSGNPQVCFLFDFETQLCPSRWLVPHKFLTNPINLCTAQFGIQGALRRFTDTSHAGCERLPPQRWPIP